MSSSFQKRLILFGFFFLLAGACSPVFSQQASQDLPVVTSAGTPDYPPSAENARIQGPVRVRVSVTEGKPSWVQIEDGPSLLWQPSIAYLRTWQFKPAPPASLLVTLQYRIEDEKVCGPQKVISVPHFPSEVDIIAKDTKSCDLVATILARNQPVNIHFDVQLNDEPVPPPAAVNLSFNGRSLSLPIQNGQFTVPLDVVRAKSVGFSLSLPLQEISTTAEGSDFAYENWKLVLADHKFGVDFQSAIPKGAKVRSSCFLTFDSMYAEAGSSKFDSQCRTILKPRK
ncbi:MAG TPA: energy transducer TonB [Candidatus Acidoferrales bacterium]|nr:energy transducer TonB [Candidatus Acidoferrales bacterium]